MFEKRQQLPRRLGSQARFLQEAGQLKASLHLVGYLIGWPGAVNRAMVTGDGVRRSPLLSRDPGQPEIGTAVIGVPAQQLLQVHGGFLEVAGFHQREAQGEPVFAVVG